MALKYETFVRNLQDAGVERGGIVHVQSDLRAIGSVDAPPTRQAILEFYFSAFMEVLGEEGTLTCCTAFEDYARYGVPFDRETSPSLTDTFSEYVRQKPGAVRSMHPIVSVTAIGGRAREICGGSHFEGFGYDSPWGRLHRADALLLSLGLGLLEGGTTFFHYVEGSYGVPYKYTKVYHYPVYADGMPIEGLFTLGVRYLDFGIENTPTRLKLFLLQHGAARLTKTGHVKSWSCKAGEAFAGCVQCLNKDRYCLLREPPRFRPGVIPDDGPTGAMQFRVDKG